MGQVPKLRFPGFNEPWEHRKLSEVTDVRDGTHNSPKYYDDGYPLVTSKNVKDGYVNYDDIQYINKGDYNEINQRSKVDKNDILMGMIGTIGNIALVRENPTFAIKNVALIKDTNNINYKFLYHCLESSYIKNQLISGINGGTQKFISLNKIRNIDMPFTVALEQQQIGVFFENLDDLIILHQCNLDDIKSLKQSMLQKMFPKNGEDKPEIRFPGFTEPWEQRKLCDIANRYDNLRIPVTEKDRVSGTTPYYGANGIQDYVDGYTHDGEYILVAEDGASDLVHYPVQYVSGKIWVNNHAHVLQGVETKASTLFLGYAISQADIISILVGGGRAKLNSDVMMKMEILLPNNCMEQQQIGAFFKNLDDLITLHQRKLDDLKQLKQALLQQMFI